MCVCVSVCVCVCVSVCECVRERERETLHTVEYHILLPWQVRVLRIPQDYTNIT